MTRDADDLRGILSERASTQNRSILGASAEDFAPRPDLFRWGLNARLLDVVEAYLGRPCAYDGVEFHYSRADGKTVSTRRWHRDREDMKQVKVILYVNDVDEEGGPFEIVHPQAQPSLDERLKWRYAIVDDGHFHSALPSKGCVPLVKTFTGARGTVLFVDTARCHHHGKPPTRDDRAAVFFGYYSRNPAHPYCCERSPVGRAQRVEWAAPLSERQRACALWRDSLPLQSRLIPRNRMII